MGKQEQEDGRGGGRDEVRAGEGAVREALSR